MANDSRDTDDDRLIYRVLHALMAKYGRSFSKADLYKVAKPIFMSVGRPDMNYGLWIARDYSRPFRLVRDDPDHSKAIIEITDSWLVRIGETEEVDQELDDMNLQFLSDTGETFDEHVKRMVADPKE